MKGFCVESYEFLRLVKDVEFDLCWDWVCMKGVGVCYEGIILKSN